MSVILHPGLVCSCRVLLPVVPQYFCTLQEGRVLLAGDAAHRFPPAGAFGMNTGIQVG